MKYQSTIVSSAILASVLMAGCLPEEVPTPQPSTPDKSSSPVGDNGSVAGTWLLYGTETIELPGQEPQTFDVEQTVTINGDLGGAIDLLECGEPFSRTFNWVETGYAWFDGDGAMASIEFDEGSARYFDLTEIYGEQPFSNIRGVKTSHTVGQVVGSISVNDATGLEEDGFYANQSLEVSCYSVRPMVPATPEGGMGDPITVADFHMTLDNDYPAVISVEKASGDVTILVSTVFEGMPDYEVVYESQGDESFSSTVTFSDSGIEGTISSDTFNMSLSATY